MLSYVAAHTYSCRAWRNVEAWVSNGFDLKHLFDPPLSGQSRVVWRSAYPCSQWSRVNFGNTVRECGLHDFAYI